MKPLAELRPSAFLLIVVNVIPLLGVLFWGWEAFAIVALYWLENVIIGVINVFKMLCSAPDDAALSNDKSNRELSKVGNQVAKLFFVPFFAVHYGGFCTGHGVFVFLLFGKEHNMSQPIHEELFDMVQTVTTGPLKWAALALAASHLISFVLNFLIGGEYRRVSVPVLMFQPYARVVLLHVAILFGGFITMAFGSPIGMLVILVIGKTLLDLVLHQWEHGRAGTPTA